MKAHRKKTVAQPKLSALEWQVCDDESIWQQTIGEPIAKPKSTMGAGRWGMPFLLLLALFVGCGGWILHKAQIGEAEITTEIQTDLQKEIQAGIVAESGSIAVPLTMLDVEPSQGWQAQISSERNQLLRLAGSDELITKIQIVDMAQDWARVQVILELPNNPTIYHQTRLYGQTGEGWVRTPPTADRWGQPRHLETSYFSLHYYSQDEEAVTGMAERLDRLYSDISRIFYASDPSSNEANFRKVVVQIDPTRDPGELPKATSADEPVIVASPAATLVPDTLAESDLLAQSLMFALFDRLTSQATQLHGMPSRWQPLQEGLQLWLIWDQELPLSHWREPIVKWVFWEEATTATSKSADFAPHLCGHHYIWMHSPLDIHIPVLCWRQNKADTNILVLHYGYPYLQKVALPPVADRTIKLQEQSEAPRQAPPLAWQVRPQAGSTANAVALATLLEYGTLTFGKDRLPILVAALPKHQNWEGLIPAVFGISLDEFEDGWNVFLAERYGIVH